MAHHDPERLEHRKTDIRRAMSELFQVDTSDARMTKHAKRFGA